LLSGSEYGGLAPFSASSTQLLSKVDKLIQRHNIGNLLKFEIQQDKRLIKDNLKFKLGNIERFYMPDEESTQRQRSGRVRRSYVSRYPSVDQYDLPAPIPIDYILVVVI
jgi:hypothetical protein